MPDVTAQTFADGRCQFVHEPTGKEIQTDRPVEFGGSGRTFSATDILAAAVASCTLTTINQVLVRDGVDPEKTKTTIDKKLSASPKRLESINMVISIDCPQSDSLEKKLRRAADTCVVKKSLSEDLTVDTRFLFHG